MCWCKSGDGFKSALRGLNKACLCPKSLTKSPFLTEPVNDKSLADLGWICLLFITLLVSLAPVRNPSSISIPGVAASTIVPSSTNAKFSKTKNGWAAQPTNAKAN